MTKPSIERVSESRCFEGRQIVYKHESSACACTMRFAVYLPPAAERAPVPALYWLSGLTCTEENFSVKAGAQRYAAELGVGADHPGHEPARRQHPGRGRANGRRHRRRLLRQCDSSAVGRALPHVRLHSRRAARRRERQSTRRSGTQIDQRPLDGRPRCDHHRHRQPAELPLRIRVRADRLGESIGLGATRADGVPGHRSAALARLRRRSRDPRQTESSTSCSSIKAWPIPISINCGRTSSRKRAARRASA